MRCQTIFCLSYPEMFSKRFYATWLFLCHVILSMPREFFYATWPYLWHVTLFVPREFFTFLYNVTCSVTWPFLRHVAFTAASNRRRPAPHSWQNCVIMTEAVWRLDWSDGDGRVSWLLRARGQQQRASWAGPQPGGGDRTTAHTPKFSKAFWKRQTLF